MSRIAPDIPELEQRIIAATEAASFLLLVAAQQPQLPKPSFTSNVILVEVDVVVTDKSGQPVRDLRAALVPLAASEIDRGTTLAAQLPIRVSSRAAANPLTINATLVRASGATLTLDRTNAAGRDYSGPGGKVSRVTLASALDAGRYRLIVEATMNRTQIVRDIEFSMPEARQ